MSWKIFTIQYLISFCLCFLFSDNHRRHCLLSICIFCTIYKSRFWFLKFFITAKEQGSEESSSCPCAFLYIMYRITVKHWSWDTELFIASDSWDWHMYGWLLQWRSAHWFVYSMVLLPWWDLCGFPACWTWLSWVLRTYSQILRLPLFFLCYTWPPFLFHQELILKASRSRWCLVPCCSAGGVLEEAAGSHLPGLRFQVCLRLDNQSNRKPGSGSYTFEWLSHQQRIL